MPDDIVECSKSPTGEHESKVVIDPMTGTPFVVCRHCGRERGAAA